jgi:hypothetical protein
MKPTNANPVELLMAWYQSRCDGDWEHQYGIHITTLDNPGWALDVDLAETPYADCILSEEAVERSEHDWLFVEARDAKFRARGGPRNLTEMIGRFVAFVSTSSGT